MEATRANLQANKRIVKWLAFYGKVYIFKVKVTLIGIFSFLRCGPCRMMGPIFADYSIKYSAAIFLKVDVDQCKVNSYDRYRCC